MHELLQVFHSRVNEAQVLSFTPVSSACQRCELWCGLQSKSEPSLVYQTAWALERYGYNTDRYHLCKATSSRMFCNGEERKERGVGRGGGGGEVTAHDVGCFSLHATGLLTVQEPAQTAAHLLQLLCKV